MPKTILDVFNQTMIAPGYDNYSGLQYTELLFIDGGYLPQLQDFGKWRDGIPFVDGDGVTQQDGFSTTSQEIGGLTYEQWYYFYTSILAGKRSGPVTFRTRRYQKDYFVIANAILTLPEPPDIDQRALGFPNFSFAYTRIEILHEDTMKGTLYVTGASTAQENIDTTPEKLTAFTTSGLNAGVTTSASDDSHTIDIADDYEVLAVVNFTSTVSTIWTFQVYVNAVAVGVLSSAPATDVASDPVQVTVSWQQTFAANDVATIYVNSDDGGGTAGITVTDAVFSIVSN